MRAVLGWSLAGLAIAALAAPAGAAAGGWATVGLSSTPDGLASGDRWVVEIEVLQHGVTPLEDAQPAVIVAERGGPGERTVAARPTGRRGVYRAEVGFPRAGTWTYAIDDGFTRVHSYPPVRIGARDAGTPRRGPAASPAPSLAGEGGNGSLWTRLGAALAGGLIAAGAARSVQRRRDRAAGAVAA